MPDENELNIVKLLPVFLAMDKKFFGWNTASFGFVTLSLALGFVSVADVIRKEGLVQSAKNFLAMGLSVEQVSKGTGLSIAEIQKHCL